MADVPVGVVFGMGLDTATAVALLITTTLRASEHIAWQAILAPPILFTAGMSPMDTFTGPLEGAQMRVAVRSPRAPGGPRQDGTSHKIYKTPWQGGPRVNIRRGKDGNAKSYQVRQVLDAIAKLEAEENEESDDDA
jgi:hypothetical protein